MIRYTLTCGRFHATGISCIELDCRIHDMLGRGYELEDMTVEIESGPEQ